MSRDPIPVKFVKVGEMYAEIVFRNEADIRKPDPELALSLSSAIPLRDNSLLLASAAAECKRGFRLNCRKTTEMHLASSLKALGRVDESISLGLTAEADFWLLSAARDFAHAELLNGGVIPAPSHLLSQIKSAPKRKHPSFKQWADASGLELASRTSCENRLEGLSLIYDHAQEQRYPRRGDDLPVRPVTAGRGGRGHGGQGQAADRLDAIRGVLRIPGPRGRPGVADLYSLHMAKISKENDFSRVIRELTVGEDRLLSEEVLKELGLVRTAEMVKSAAAPLKASVSALAKRI